MAVGIPHQGDKWEIHDEDPESNGKKKERFIFFGYGKVDDPERVRKFWKMGAKI